MLPSVFTLRLNDEEEALNLGGILNHFVDRLLDNLLTSRNSSPAIVTLFPHAGIDFQR